MYIAIAKAHGQETVAHIVVSCLIMRKKFTYTHPHFQNYFSGLYRGLPFKWRKGWNEAGGEEWTGRKEKGRRERGVACLRTFRSKCRR